MTDAPQVTDDPAGSRFVYAVDGQEAELLYRLRGRRLVTAAVRRAATEGLAIVPSCPFARDWLDRHPGVASQVPIDVPR